MTGVERGAAEEYFYPTFLPDGRHFLFMARRTPRETSAIMLGSLDSPKTRSLVLAESQALYAPPGYILFLRSQTLMAQAFDADALELRGEPFPVADGVKDYPEYGWGEFAISLDGTLAFRRDVTTLKQLTWLDRAGRPQGMIGEPGPYSTLALSPDGSRLALAQGQLGSGGRQIFLFDLKQGSSRRFTLGEGVYNCPTWSRDGQQVYFASNKSADWEILRKPSDGGNAEGIVMPANSAICPQETSPDGQWLSFFGQEQMGVRLLSLQGDRLPTELVGTPIGTFHARWSPDGHWVAYDVATE